MGYLEPVSALRSTAQSLVNGEATFFPALGVGVIVGGVSLLVGSARSELEVEVGLASMATFLFGVLLAFTIARARERLLLLQDTISKNDAALLSIHQIVAVFPEDDRVRIRGLIDEQLTSEIDYQLVDYYYSSSAHLALAAAIYALEPQSQQQIGGYRELVRLCIEVGSNRSIIESITGQSLSALEWSGLILLLFLLDGLIAVISGGTLLGALAAGVMAGTLTTLMVLLRKLDLLRWHERVSIWEPTTRLFRSMGLDPYVPRVVIDSGRYRPTGRIRVVDYPHPYPDRSSKRVSVEVRDQQGQLLTDSSASRSARTQESEAQGLP
jgi:hypothetical protein